MHFQKSLLKIHYNVNVTLNLSEKCYLIDLNRIGLNFRRPKFSSPHEIFVTQDRRITTNRPKFGDFSKFPSSVLISIKHAPQDINQKIGNLFRGYTSFREWILMLILWCCFCILKQCFPPWINPL